MPRRLAPGLLAVAAMLLTAPAGAQARTPCAAEQSAPTAANGPAVSDAIFCLTNQIRSSYGLAPFRRETHLDAAALLHSQDMATRNFFAHVNPDGLDPTARAAAQGYTLGVGENIAAGYANARAVMIGWMASKGHCENLLGSARELGVGTFPTPRPYYTQDFGDYAFGTTSAAAAGCPYNVDLDALVPADPPVPVAAGPASASQPGAPPAAADPPPTPALGELGLSRTLLHPGGSTHVTYTLSAPATVTFRIQHDHGGRWRTLGHSFRQDGEQGTNTLTFRAGLRGRLMAVGRYRLTAVATDADGERSAVRRVRFRVARG